jgi:hypothetical protein
MTTLRNTLFGATVLAASAFTPLPVMATCTAMTNPDAGPYTFGMPDVVPNTAPTEQQAESYFLTNVCSQHADTQGATCVAGTPLHYNGSQNGSSTFSGALCGIGIENPITVTLTVTEWFAFSSDKNVQRQYCQQAGLPSSNPMIQSVTNGNHNTYIVKLLCQ